MYLKYNSFIYILPFIIFSCINDCEIENSFAHIIWSDHILSFEFNNDKELHFFKDTLEASTTYILQFQSNENFDKSKFINLKKTKHWLKPLKIDDKIFLIDFEARKVSENWFLLKNDNFSLPYLWVSSRSVSVENFKNWEEYLLQITDIELKKGTCNRFREKPKLDSKVIPSHKINCLKVLEVNEEWITLSYKNICEIETTSNIAYIRWKDNNQLLIEF